MRTYLRLALLTIAPGRCLPIASLIAALATSCVVEVGNPQSGASSKKPDTNTGTIAVRIRDGKALSDQIVSINVKDIAAQTKDGSNQELGSGLARAVALGEEFASLADNADIPAGTYQGLTLTLDSDMPGTFQKQGSATKASLVLPQKKSTLTFSEEFTVEQGKSSSIDLILDTSDTLTPVDKDNPNGSISFDPRVAALQRAFAATAEVTVANADAGILCAYLVKATPPPGANNVPPPPMLGQGPPNPNGGLTTDDGTPPMTPKINIPESAAQLVKDTKDSKDDKKPCRHAFLAATLSNGKGSLFPLAPMTDLYVRFFPDGSITYIDSKVTERLAPKATYQVKISK